jgi:hypothetical protein
VLGRLYPGVELRDGAITAERATADDEALLGRASVLISAHLP